MGGLPPWAAKTASLILQNYEELLPLPLATVRKRLHLPDGRIAHGPGTPARDLRMEFRRKGTR